MGLITFQYGDLSKTVIGVACQETKTITLNESCRNLKWTKYYTVMLERAMVDGYDCALEYDGSDVIRKLMVTL